MEHLSLLQTIAAVAITLIGFTGIVVTAGPLGSGRRTPLDRIVFYPMIAPPLTALFCAFVPELVSTLLFTVTTGSSRDAVHIEALSLVTHMRTACPPKFGLYQQQKRAPAGALPG